MLCVTEEDNPVANLKQRVYEIIIDPPKGDRLANTVNGGIMVLIAANITAGIIETVEPIGKAFPAFFTWFEIFSVAVFSIEYVLRLWSCTIHQGDSDIKAR